MESPSKRFWRKVSKSGPCWEWTASLTARGYGRFYDGEKVVAAHVWALEQKLGRKLLPGKKGLHSCDNKACVRDDHLFEGTQRDNILDMISKGRGNLQAGAQCGEKNPRAKITREQAEEIRLIVGERQRDIAARYGITQAVVSKIVRRQIWG